MSSPQLTGETESLGESVEQTEGTTTQETAAASTEERLAKDVEEQAEKNEQVEEPLLDGADIAQEDAVSEVATDVEKTEAGKEDHPENDQPTASAENEDTTQTEKQVPEEKESEGEEVGESPLKEERHSEEEELSETEEAEEETQWEEESASEGEKGEEQSLTEEDDHKSEKMLSVSDVAVKEVPLEEDVPEREEEQQNIAPVQEVPGETNSSSEDQCK